jgi:tetratricopeptide (TPR) repeat protein
VTFPDMIFAGFVLAVDVTAKGSGAYSPLITWQGGHQTFALNVGQHSWATRYCDAGGCDPDYASGYDPLIAAGKTLRMMVITRGKEFALYLDGSPLAYVNDPSRAEGDDMSLAAQTAAAEQSILVAYDNFELWDLDNVPGLLSQGGAARPQREAVPSTQAAPAVAPAMSAQQHADQANTYRAQLRWDEAPAEISRTIELDPANPQYYIARASIYDAGKGMMNEALADAAKAVELAPALYEAWACGARSMTTWKSATWPSPTRTRPFS